MKKEVRIKVAGTQTPIPADDRLLAGQLLTDDLLESEDSTTIELDTTGVFYSKDGLNMLKYDEYYDDGENPIQNLLKFDSDNIVLTKCGGVNTVMSFGGDKWMKASYNTPYGPLQVNILTRDYSMELNDETGRIELKYFIDFGQEYVFMCNLDIDICM